jgi:hypothetical protein
MLIILFISYDAFPCSQSSATFFNTKELAKDPTKAKAIYVGVVNEKNGNIFLNVERNWTAAPLIAVNVGSTQNPCPHENYLPNIKYLFYALNDYQAFVKKSSWIFIMEPLKGSKSTIEKFSSRKYFVGEINPSWQFCESDSDCVQSKNLCRKTIGINKKYEKDYLNFLKNKKAITNCSEVEKAKPSVTRCVENFCS